jgi:hypothetical protein
VRLLGASSRLVGNKQCPRPQPGALTASRGWSERRLIVEVAAALGLPLPPLVTLAVPALAGPLDLGRGPLQRSAHFISLDLGHATGLRGGNCRDIQLRYALSIYRTPRPAQGRA